LAAYRDPLRPVAIALHPLLPELATISLTKNSRALIWFAEAPDLNHAQQELEIVRSIFPNHVIATSRESALQSLRNEYDLVHVIAHATHRPENPSFSSIEFADGSVFVHEITGSALRTQFAMLAACDTGSVGVGVPQEPDGLARAFVARGAKAAVGSQWALSDQISPVLVQSYYEKLFQSSDPLASLTHCQQVGRQFNPHPYYWAPFTVYAGMTE
jgi:CHAT domain-containing protein